jgi:hypothetical protein
MATSQWQTYQRQRYRRKTYTTTRASPEHEIKDMVGANKAREIVAVLHCTPPPQQRMNKPDDRSLDPDH